MTNTAFGALLGVTKVRIGQLIAQGKIPQDCLVDVGGKRKKIDSDLALAALGGTISRMNPSKVLGDQEAAGAGLVKSTKEEYREIAEAFLREPSAAIAEIPPAMARQKSVPQTKKEADVYAVHQKNKMRAQAGIEALKLQRARGEVIDKAEVEREIFAILRAVRDRFMESKDFLLQALEAFFIPGVDIRKVEAAIDKEYDNILAAVMERLGK